jgi:hypothetical protein
MSYDSPRAIAGYTIPEIGNFEIQISGDYQYQLKGKIYINSTIKTGVNGTQYSRIELNFSSTSPNDPTVGFLVSKISTSSQSMSGSYEITPNIEGFISAFEGVFGFANIGSQNELPFFAKRGHLLLRSKNSNKLTGTMEVSFENSIGKKLFVSGNFIALIR